MSNGAVLPDPHAASLLGQETEPPVHRPRPLFRHYPGPVVCSIVGALFGALTAFGKQTSLRYADIDAITIADRAVDNDLEPLRNGIAQ
jgi:hypothetical protein